MSPARPLLYAFSLLPAVAIAQTSARFDPQSGDYAILDRVSGWRLAGTIGPGAQNVRHSAGTDRIGAYDEIAFEWAVPSAVRGTIRTYAGARTAWFDLKYLGLKSGQAVVFPRFTTVPEGLKGFSFHNTTFAPGRPGLAETGTPWLRFDAQNRAMVLSPASNFMVEKMLGDETSMGVGMDDGLEGVPQDVGQDSLLVFGDGIGRAWDAWGTALRALYDRKTPAYDDGAVLRDYGYWTDNGADYYYDYDPAKGYAGTLLALRDYYRAQGLPMGYLQLDSWWYDKTKASPEGKHGGARNPRLPSGAWNRYGGTQVYRADKTLFPDGLAAFQKRLGLPLVVHGRWIDPKSPYHKAYEISGLAPVDPRYWADTADYLAKSGVAVYEQDWLDEIYANSPRFATRIGVADAFTGNMAAAMDKRGLDLQYCMGLPKYYLQGVQYPNLTTVRASGDRFDRDKWAHFLFTSELVRQIGAYPWTDVFKSKETGNLTLALLSAGPVGTGDAIGREDKANILRAARPDGVLVKADRPATPLDLVYQNRAQGRHLPLVAETTTGEGELTTRYLFAFTQKEDEPTLTLRPADIAMTKPSIVCDLKTGETRVWQPSETIAMPVPSDYAYEAIVPITRTGVALIGDLGKIVPSGRSRIASLADGADGLHIGVAFAKGEGPVTLTGVCPRSPNVRAVRGRARLVRFDPATGRFTVEVAVEGVSAELIIDGRG